MLNFKKGYVAGNGFEIRILHELWEAENSTIATNPTPLLDDRRVSESFYIDRICCREIRKRKQIKYYYIRFPYLV